MHGAPRARASARRGAEPGLKPGLVVPQLFGGLFLFRPADAPHEVTKVAAPDDHPRLTVTASYLYGDRRR